MMMTAFTLLLTGLLLLAQLQEIAPYAVLQSFDESVDASASAFDRHVYGSPSHKSGRIIHGLVSGKEAYKGVAWQNVPKNARQGFTAYLKDPRNPTACALSSSCFVQSPLPDRDLGRSSAGKFDPWTYSTTKQDYARASSYMLPSAGKSVVLSIGGTRTLEVSFDAMQLERVSVDGDTGAVSKSIIGESVTWTGLTIRRALTSQADGGTNDRRDVKLLTSAATDASASAIVAVTFSVDFLSHLRLCDFGPDNPDNDANFPEGSMPCGPLFTLHGGQFPAMWGPVIAKKNEYAFYVVSIGCTASDCASPSSAGARQIVIRACASNLTPSTQPEVQCSEDGDGNGWNGGMDSQYELFRARQAYAGGQTIPGATSSAKISPGDNPRLVGAEGGISGGRFAVAFIKHNNHTARSGIAAVFMCRTRPGGAPGTLHGIEQCGPAQLLSSSEDHLPAFEIMGVVSIPGEDRFIIMVAVDSGPCDPNVDSSCPSERIQKVYLSICAASSSDTSDLHLACTLLEDKLAGGTNRATCAGTADQSLGADACDALLTGGPPALRGPDNINNETKWRLQLLAAGTLYQWGIAARTASSSEYTLSADGSTVYFAGGGINLLDNFLRTGRPRNNATFVMNALNASFGRSFMLESTIGGFRPGAIATVRGIDHPILNASSMVYRGAAFEIVDVDDVTLTLTSFVIAGNDGSSFIGGVSDGAALKIQASGAVVHLEDMQFLANAVSQNGGAVFLADQRQGVDARSSTLIARHARFVRNRAGYIGGAVYAQQSFSCHNCSFIGNVASLGATVAVTGSVLWSVPCPLGRHTKQEGDDDGVVSQALGGVIGLTNDMVQDVIAEKAGGKDDQIEEITSGNSNIQVDMKGCYCRPACAYTFSFRTRFLAHMCILPVMVLVTWITTRIIFMIESKYGNLQRVEDEAHSEMNLEFASKVLQGLKSSSWKQQARVDLKIMRQFEESRRKKRPGIFSLYKARGRAWKNVGFLIFLLYPGLTVACFEAVFCTEIDGGEYFLRRDLSVKCWTANGITPEYTSLTISAILFIILYVVGIPVGLFIVLKLHGARQLMTDYEEWYKKEVVDDENAVGQTPNEKTEEEKVVLVAAEFVEEEEEQQLSPGEVREQNLKTFEQIRDEIMEEMKKKQTEHLDVLAMEKAEDLEVQRLLLKFDDFMQRFGQQFTEDYEPKYYYWDCIEMLKKACLTGLLVVIRPGSSTQVLAAVLISLLYLVIVMETKPFVDSTSDRLAAAVTFQMLLTLLTGYALKTQTMEEDDFLRNILAKNKSIAVVGASPNEMRPSFFLFKYLHDKSYTMHPVNPAAVAKGITHILGQKVYSSLDELHADGIEPDMVDIFRSAEEVPGIVEDAIRIGAKTIWMQLGVVNEEAAAVAESAGLDVVMDRCPKIELSRLSGELGWHGFDSKIISSKRRRGANGGAPAFTGFETRAVHAGSHPDERTGARQTPIFQNTSYVFEDVDQAASLFNLQTFGNIYGRLSNPTTAVLEERLASLEGGRGATCTSSGHAAQMLALFPLMSPGDTLVASDKLYGGSITQFGKTFQKFGWNCEFVDATDIEKVRSAVSKPGVKALWSESIANPGGVISDLSALAEVANHNEVPLIVDNTLATPFLCRPIEWGASIVVHSTTKAISGNGTTMGGAVIDSGLFPWEKYPEKYPSMAAPEPAYHGLVFAETFGDLAFTVYSHAVTLRDLGSTMAPMHSFLTLLGTETLSCRMDRHVQNAGKIASFLKNDGRVSWVSYAGSEDSPYHHLAQKYIRGASGGSVFTFGVNGGYDAGVRVVESAELFSHLANVGDARSLILHPASTTHRQLTPEQREACGAGDDVIRISVGLESVDDLIADLDFALG
eukprot:g4025.t1